MENEVLKCLNCGDLTLQKEFICNNCGHDEFEKTEYHMLRELE